MPPITFFLVPITSLFLVCSLGLVAKDIAGLAFVIQQFNDGGSGYRGGSGDGSYGDGGNEGSSGATAWVWGPDLGPNFSTYTYYLPPDYTYTTPPSTPVIDPYTSDFGGYGGGGPAPTYPIVTVTYSWATFTQVEFSDGWEWGQAFGPAFSTYSYYLPIYYTSTTPPSTTYSVTPGVEPPTETSSQAISTPAPALARRVIQPTPLPFQPKVNKRQSIYDGSGSYGVNDNPYFQTYLDGSGIKAKTDAALALFVIQLVCIVGLLLLNSVFLIKHRKFHKGGYSYEQTLFFHSFHKGFGILSALYFTSGIICFAILGSESESHIGAILAATIALWSITIVCLLGLLFALKYDARKSERNEGDHQQKSKEDGGETGKGESTPNQEQRQQSHGQQQVISMPEPHSPQ